MSAANEYGRRSSVFLSLVLAPWPVCVIAPVCIPTRRSFARSPDCALRAEVVVIANAPTCRHRFTGCELRALQLLIRYHRLRLGKYSDAFHLSTTEAPETASGGASPATPCA